LVLFSTIINLGSIIIFILLDKFIHFRALFKESDGAVTAFIGHAIAERLTALDLFKRETNYFIHNSMLFNLELFNSNTRYISENSDYKSINVKKKFFIKTKEEKYDFLKQLQGELQILSRITA
jgi:phosphate:Na+ symporter